MRRREIKQISGWNGAPFRLGWMCNEGQWRAARSAPAVGEHDSPDPFFDILNGRLWMERGGVKVRPKRMLAEYELRWKIAPDSESIQAESTTFHLGQVLPLAEVAFWLARDHRRKHVRRVPGWHRTDAPSEHQYFISLEGYRAEYNLSFAAPGGDWGCILRSSHPMDRGWVVEVDLREVLDAIDVFLGEFYTAVKTNAPELLDWPWFDELTDWAKARGL